MAMSQFWQYTHSKVQPEKKMVWLGTSSGSSPICRKSELYFDSRGTPQKPVFPADLSAQHLRSQQTHSESIRPASSTLTSSRLGPTGGAPCVGARSSRRPTWLLPSRLARTSSSSLA